MNRRYASLLCLLPILMTPPGAGAQSASPPLRPMIQVQPDYPPAAVAQGAEGHVELEVTIDELGAVAEAQVTAAMPAGVFDAAARAAVLRWRYPAEPGREPRHVQERIEFRIPVMPAIARRGSDAPAALGAVGSGARNACIREGSRFNYGDRVEVQLINACDVPLAVASCAAGTGQYNARWSCSTTAGSGTLLVASSDARLGESTLVDEHALTFTDRFVLTRAPNSEYWWLACTLADAACRDAAAGWVRSLDGQLSSADPQGRSSVPLARSH